MHRRIIGAFENNSPTLCARSCMQASRDLRYRDIFLRSVHAPSHNLDADLCTYVPFSCPVPWKCKSAGDYLGIRRRLCSPGLRNDNMEFCAQCYHDDENGLRRRLCKVERNMREDRDDVLDQLLELATRVEGLEGIVGDCSCAPRLRISATTSFHVFAADSGGLD